MGKETFDLGKKVWKAVKYTAETHETSWSRGARDYRMSITDAANKVCEDWSLPDSFSKLIELVLEHSWNEALDWADYYTEGKGSENADERN